jgi:uncharacterized protein
MAHPHEDLLRREAVASLRGTWIAEDFYTEDHVLHYPGRSPLAGEYRGHTGLSEFGQRLTALASSMASMERELHDAIANEEHGVQLAQVRAERKDATRHEWRVAWVFHFRQGKISESWSTSMTSWPWMTS